jgi:ABC-type iron transport system FetAB ATPase subunit
MLRPSAMILGPTGIGRHALINITAVLPTGDEVTLRLERVHQLRGSLERCRERREYCEGQLSEFIESADLSDPRQQRREKKLRADLERAESDVRALEKQLDDLMD